MNVYVLDNNGSKRKVQVTGTDLKRNMILGIDCESNRKVGFTAFDIVAFEIDPTFDVEVQVNAIQHRMEVMNAANPSDKGRALEDHNPIMSCGIPRRGDNCSVQESKTRRAVRRRKETFEGHGS